METATVTTTGPLQSTESEFTVTEPVISPSQLEVAHCRVATSAESLKMLGAARHNRIVQATRRAVQLFSFSKVPARTLPTVLADFYPELGASDCLACAAAAVEACTFATGPWLHTKLVPTDLELPTSAESESYTALHAPGGVPTPEVGATPDAPAVQSSTVFTEPYTARCIVGVREGFCVS